MKVSILPAFFSSEEMMLASSTFLSGSFD